MALRNVVLAVCILATAMCGAAFVENNQPTLNHCMTLCNMNQQAIPVDNPYPGLNVPSSSMSYYGGTIKPALTGLGFSRSCSEGGCTFRASAPVDCSAAVHNLGRCNFPNRNGVLKSPINVNWVY